MYFAKQHNLIRKTSLNFSGTTTRQKSPAQPSLGPKFLISRTHRIIAGNFASPGDTRARRAPAAQPFLDVSPFAPPPPSSAPHTRARARTSPPERPRCTAPRAYRVTPGIILLIMISEYDFRARSLARSRSRRETENAQPKI